MKIIRIEGVKAEMRTPYAGALPRPVVVEGLDLVPSNGGDKHSGLYLFGGKAYYVLYRYGSEKGELSQPLAAMQVCDFVPGWVVVLDDKPTPWTPKEEI